MHFKLISFSEDGSIRRFVFKKSGDPNHPPLTVIADVELARKRNVPLQDLPSLCARLLEARGEDQQVGTLVVTDADLGVLAAANSAAAREIAERRALRSNRKKVAAQAESAATTAEIAGPALNAND